MRLVHLELIDYRNYPSLSLDFHRLREIFLGDNAQGKTNLLEAIAILGMGRSPFSSKDENLVRWDADKAIIRSLFEREEGIIAIDLLFQRGGKRSIKLNGLYQKRVADLIGKISIVLFTCQDILMVKGSPSLRRNYLDGIAVQLSANYYRILHSYEKVLSQRNFVLKQHGKGGDLEVWDLQLAKLACELYERRRRLISELAPLAKRWHERISEGKETLELVFEPSMKNLDLAGESSFWFDALLAEWKENQEKEIQRGTTLSGPHRDDLLLLLNGKDSRNYASQGQQRSIVLSLKLAELEILRERLGEPPILLLDDVLAELDVKRQNSLLASIGQEIQTFVTTTHLSDFSAGWIEESEIFSITDGKAVLLRGNGG